MFSPVIDQTLTLRISRAYSQSTGNGDYLDLEFVPGDPMY